MAMFTILCSLQLFKLIIIFFGGYSSVAVRVKTVKVNFKATLLQRTQLLTKSRTQVPGGLRKCSEALITLIAKGKTG